MASAAGAAPAATTAATAGVAAPLPAFVAGARKLVEGGGAGSGAVTVVMGNQAADADSIISSITYAYYKSLTVHCAAAMHTVLEAFAHGCCCMAVAAGYGR